MTERYETNPRKLPWPQDIGGITAKLQREGCRAIGRIGGQDKHYAVVLEVLRVLAKHAESKLQQQKEGLLAKQAHAAQKLEERRVAKLGDISAQRLNIEKNMKQMSDQLKQLKATAETPHLQPTVPHKVVELPTVKKTVTNQVAPVKVAQPAKAKSLSERASSQGLGAPQATS